MLKIHLVGWRSMKPKKSDKIHYNRSAPENAGPPLVKREKCLLGRKYPRSGFYIPTWYGVFIFQPSQKQLIFDFRRSLVNWQTRVSFQYRRYPTTNTIHTRHCAVETKSPDHGCVRRGVRMTHILAISFALSVRLRFHCDSDSEHRRAKIGKHTIVYY